MEATGDESKVNIVAGTFVYLELSGEDSTVSSSEINKKY